MNNVDVEVKIILPVNQRKNMFFESEKILKDTVDGTNRALSAIGAYVMKVARNSMKPGGPKLRKKHGKVSFVLKQPTGEVHAKAGEAPRWHGAALLRGRTGVAGIGILFHNDKAKQSVIIGPTAFKTPLKGQSPQAPEALEKGLPVRMLKPKWRTVGHGTDRRFEKIGFKMVMAKYKNHAYMVPALQKTISTGIVDKHLKNLLALKSVSISTAA